MLLISNILYCDYSVSTSQSILFSSIEELTGESLVYQAECLLPGPL